mmetsp:Transcript_17396/g.25350  ORF Transcript_17396/g.25350 Transcript_17396/m.25350 type:complete len:188 (+) Transcript_17396:187-750(+)
MATKEDMDEVEGEKDEVVVEEEILVEEEVVVEAGAKEVTDAIAIEMVTEEGMDEVEGEEGDVVVEVVIESHLQFRWSTCMSIDTACSSSLVAIHAGSKTSRDNECEGAVVAVVAGTNSMLTPTVQLAYGSAGMLSQRDQCSTFGESGDGYLCGEGCAAVVLKQLPNESDESTSGARAILSAVQVEQW